MNNPEKLKEIHKANNTLNKRNYHDFAAGRIPGNNPARNDAKRPPIDVNVPPPTHESDLEMPTTEKPHPPEQEQMKNLVNDMEIKTLIDLKNTILGLKNFKVSWAQTNHNTCLSLRQDITALIDFKRNDVSEGNVSEAMKRIITVVKEIPTSSPHIGGFLSEIKRIRQVDDTDSSSHWDKAERVPQRDHVQSGSSSNSQKEQIGHISLEEGAVKSLKELEVISVKRSINHKNSKNIIYWKNIRDKIGDVLAKDFLKQDYTNDIKELKDIMKGDNAILSMKKLYEEKLQSFFPDL